MDNSGCMYKERNYMIKYSSKRMIEIFSVILLIYMIFSITRAALYSVMASDDVSDAVNIGVYNVPLSYYLKCCLAYTKKIYLTWQGTYSAMLIQSVLSPLNNYGFPQLRVVMIVNALLFFCAFVAFTYELLWTIGKEYLHIKLIILAIAVFCVCGYRSYYEIFTWFTGAANYTIPISFLLIGLLSFIKMNHSYKAACLIGAMLFGSFSMGGSLAITAVGCSVVVLLSVYYFITNRVSVKKNVAITSVWIVFAAVNVFAPGNYVRHDAIDNSGLHPFNALHDAVDMASTRWQFFFKSTDFVFLMLIIAGFGFYLAEENTVFDNLRLKLTISSIGLLTPLIAAFPVALGYSSNTIPDRCGFVIDLCIIVSGIICSFYLGIDVKERIGDINRGLFKQCYILIVIVVFLMDGFGISNIKVREISRDLWNGVYKTHYNECVEFMDSLWNYERNSDVQISKDEVPDEIDNVFNLVIEDYAYDWKNVYIAKYYGFSSICTKEGD